MSEKAAVYEFWLWEYQRRNKEYIKNFDCLLNRWEQDFPCLQFPESKIDLFVLLMLIKLEDFQDVLVKERENFRGVEDLSEKDVKHIKRHINEILIFESLHHRYPRHSDDGFDGKTLILKALEGSCISNSHYDDFSSKNMALKRFKINNYGYAEALIDVKNMTPNIYNEIQAKYVDSYLNLESSGAELRMQSLYDGLIHNTLNKSIQHTPAKRSLHNDAMRRACGLYLYDYHVVGNYSMKKASEQIEAILGNNINVFKTILNQASQSKMVSSTKRCIESVEVYSIQT